jgi:hypothetical protein
MTETAETGRKQEVVPAGPWCGATQIVVALSFSLVGVEARERM